MNFNKMISGATPSQGGNYLRDGIYSLLVEKVVQHQGNDGPTFVAELRVTESKKTEQDVEPNPVGTTVSYAQVLMKFKSAPGNAKAFLLGVLGGLGYAESDLTDQLVDEVVGDGQPLRGAQVKCSTYRKMTRDGSKMLTLPKWQSVAQDEAAIKRGREFLDQTKAVEEDEGLAPVVAAPATPTAVPGGVLSRLGKR